jgi:hypothetical protein
MKYIVNYLIFNYLRAHISVTIISQRCNIVVISTSSLVSAVIFHEAAITYIFLESNFSGDILNIANINYETRS